MDAVNDLVVKLDDLTIVISSAALRDLLMSGIPESALDPESDVRKDHWAIFGLLKRFLEAMMPIIFKKKLGTDMPKLPKGTDIIAFSTKFMCEYVSQDASNRQVEFIADRELDESGKVIYRVYDLAPVSEAISQEAVV